MEQKHNRLAILCGGGPAPGINGVISSAAIEAVNHRWEVIGLLDGFKHISKGRLEHVPLTIETVSRIHNEGGSVIRTSRHNPTADPKDMERAVDTLAEAGVTHLITIGGDDTAFSALRISQEALSRRGYLLKVAHVPKTIDNDLPLPEGVPTFGFETARSLGAMLVSNIMEDARTTGRWFLCVTMGRSSGHLALGIGKAAAATITIIPEEFGGRVSLDALSDLIVGSIVKRLAMGRAYGVAVVAEGLMSKIPPEELEELKTADRDEHGHVRYGEVNFSDILRDRVKAALRELGIKITLNDKEIGYEVRCAPPNGFDVEYTRNLGYGAFEYLRQGGTGAMVTIQNNRLVPIPLEDIMDPATGRTRIRLVNVNSIQYQIARRYMIRLEKEDFEDPERLKALCQAANMEKEAFVRRFGPLVEG
ncbi:MAG: diphosphate--fructose-6-phosphate 1-phosphotransferase [Thermanaerothrix sp.]|nr:diphosphate--fructose-6-phosphate 1-phosphotransferase [Thermanaerothrix sp.]